MNATTSFKELKNSFGKVYLTIHYNDARRWIYNEWQGLLSLENVKEGATEVLKLLQEKECSLLLNDNRQIIGSWSHSNDWIANEWIPAAIDVGLKRFAHIVSPGIFGAASAVEMQHRVGDKFEMRLFQDIDAAESWLEEPF
jgi:hypothetical protein